MQDGADPKRDQADDNAAQNIFSFSEVNEQMERQNNQDKGQNIKTGAQQIFDAVTDRPQHGCIARKKANQKQNRQNQQDDDGRSGSAACSLLGGRLLLFGI